ncbi:MFS transporter [Candidatus Woesearchaeota archaeon]|nr:MFS transporter [Candidatus Woesearchaeota archaeon]
MHNHRQHNHYIHMILKNKELRDMYLALSLKTLAMSMVGIFIPIFLIVERGMDLGGIILFYFFASLGYILTAPFAGKFVSRFGLKNSAMLTIPMFIIFYLGMFSSENLGFSLNYLALFLGITQAMYWIPFTTHFVRSSDKRHRSEEVGLLSAIMIVSSMSGPFFGALVINWLGFGFLFKLASGLLALGIIPLMFTKYNHESFRCRLKDIRKIPGRLTLKMFAFGATNTVELVFWPVFLFSVVNAYTSFGLIFLIAEFGSLLGAMWLGSIEDRNKLLKILRIGGILCSFIWLSRVFLTGAIVLAAVTIVGAFLHNLVEIPFNTLEYDRFVKKKYLAEFVVFRGILESVGRIVLLGILAIFMHYNAAFLTSSLMYLTYLF